MKLPLEAIREHWRKQALDHGHDVAASWTDTYAIHLEIAEISKRLGEVTRAIDIGCGNGYSTIHYALDHPIDIKGIDYIPEMIAVARRRLQNLAGQLQGNVSFEVGDMTNLDEEDGRYDAAIVTRVIINLASRDSQIAAIREIARLVRPQGRIFMSEATREGWIQLNSFRAEWELEPIPEPPFNRYIDEDLVRSAAPDLLELEEISNFASTYFVGTRVLKPLLLRAIGSSIDPATTDMNWNRFFALLPAVGDYGTQKLFILRRR
jgi:ubiquinone/menaquinone biosynthesis C-methylase UbiE